MQIVRLAAGLALSLLSLPALAQQQPAAPPQTKAETDLNAAWQQMVGAAETAAISGPDQLRAAKAAQGALQAWMAEQRQKLADMAHDNQAKLEAVQKDRQTLAAQIASLNKQLADAKKPDPRDQERIRNLTLEVAHMRQSCHVSSDLPHSTPAPGRK